MVIDDLIGIVNCCYFFDWVEKEFDCVCCFEMFLLVVFIDFDVFKLINDMYGYVVGDFVLWEIVCLLCCYVCSVDMVV